ncbi:hypothetical protein NDU88_005382 [Pleurodeles waltl]|uniref:Uncharacterized protein n=1 Tax=Pleurodeles waltl TaxID=8319 RepID=A0AAV7UIJ6_PLEWA|nr:hypothetical protein NDU88_005382 [Pleurodeles waltl]
MTWTTSGAPGHDAADWETRRQQNAEDGHALGERGLTRASNVSATIPGESEEISQGRRLRGRPEAAMRPGLRGLRQGRSCVLASGEAQRESA